MHSDLHPRDNDRLEVALIGPLSALGGDHLLGRSNASHVLETKEGRGDDGLASGTPRRSAVLLPGTTFFSKLPSCSTRRTSL